MNIRTSKVLNSARLGYRGAFLLCLAFIDLAYGWSLISPSAETRQGSSYAWRTEFLPSSIWGLMWVTGGIFLATQAWSRHDRAAYGVALALKFTWSFIGFASSVVGAVTQGWVLGVIFLVYGAMTFIVSRWPEPITSHTVTTMTEEDPRPGGTE